jgi:hypothetical protein
MSSLESRNASVRSSPPRTDLSRATPNTGLTDQSKSWVLCFDGDNVATLKDRDSECAHQYELPEKMRLTYEKFWATAHDYWDKYPTGKENTAQEYGSDTENLFREADRAILEVQSSPIMTPTGERPLTPAEAETMMGDLSRSARSATDDQSAQ